MASLFLHNILTEEKRSWNTQLGFFFQGLHACFPNFSKVISEEGNKLQEKTPFFNHSFLEIKKKKISKCSNGKQKKKPNPKEKNNHIVWVFLIHKYPIKSSFSSHKGPKWHFHCLQARQLNLRSVDRHWRGIKSLQKPCTCWKANLRVCQPK